MTPKLCRYGCGIMLEGFDEEQRKYLEAQTGGLHTKERCQEAKAKKAAGPIPTTDYLEKVYPKEKDDHGNENVEAIGRFAEVMLDHGNESISPKEYVERLGYVDHTQGQKLKLKIFTDPNPEGLMLIYNNFAEWNNIKFSQYQIAGSLYTIAVWYSEETK